MAVIITRILEETAKNSELTVAEVDQNLINLKEAIDILEALKFEIELELSGG